MAEKFCKITKLKNRNHNYKIEIISFVLENVVLLVYIRISFEVQMYNFWCADVQHLKRGGKTSVKLLLFSLEHNHYNQYLNDKNVG